MVSQYAENSWASPSGFRLCQAKAQRFLEHSSGACEEVMANRTEELYYFSKVSICISFSELMPC